MPKRQNKKNTSPEVFSLVCIAISGRRGFCYGPPRLFVIGSCQPKWQMFFEKREVYQTLERRVLSGLLVYAASER